MRLVYKAGRAAREIARFMVIAPLTLGALALVGGRFMVIAPLTLGALALVGGLELVEGLYRSVKGWIHNV